MHAPEWLLDWEERLETWKDHERGMRLGGAEDHGWVFEAFRVGDIFEATLQNLWSDERREEPQKVQHAARQMEKAKYKILESKTRQKKLWISNADAAYIRVYKEKTGLCSYCKVQRQGASRPWAAQPLLRHPVISNLKEASWRFFPGQSILRVWWADASSSVP